MSDRIGKEPLDNKGFYEQQTKEQVSVEIDRLIDLWNRFLKAQGCTHLSVNKDYFIHKRNLYEVVKRLDKRRTYYYVFHQISDICEYKEIGILAYWINTLKPFMVVNSSCSIYSSPNEMFSLYLILCGLAEIHEKRHPEKTFKMLDSHTIQDYVYNFKYCDLNREAMIFFVETLAKSYGIGMETNASYDKYTETIENP